MGFQVGKSPEPVLFGSDKSSVQIGIYQGSGWSKAIQLDNLGIKGTISLVQEVTAEGLPVVAGGWGPSSFDLQVRTVTLILLCPPSQMQASLPLNSLLALHAPTVFVHGMPL
jgi:hypothetical protein